MRPLSSLPAAAKPAVSLFIDFVPVVDVPAGATDRRADRRAFSAAEQGPGHRADSGSSRRAPNRFAGGILASVMMIIIGAIAVVPGRIIVTSVISVLRHRAWSGGGGYQKTENYR